jgi:hypothetical protein
MIPHRGFRLARAFGGTKSDNHHSAPDDAGKPLGLLLNFHVPVLHAGIKRVILCATDSQTHR